jgi:Do/DeqQ family serine protease
MMNSIHAKSKNLVSQSIKIASLAMLGALSACGPGQTQTDTKPPFEGKSFESPPKAERIVPKDALSAKSSFAPVVQKAAPAVVNIYAKSVRRAQVDPFWSLFNGMEPQARVQESRGSGVIVRSDGIVVTNHHVVDGAQSFMVVLNDRREYQAKLLLSDPRTDLAVLKIEKPGENFTALIMDDGRDQQVGDLVLAIGNPFGVGQSVTNGIISAVNRTDVGSGEGAYIQTDAAINPGNSGGALVDMQGNLIGINSFILSRSGSSAGVGFAIPAQMVRRVVDSAIGGASVVRRTWLGARGEAVTGEIAKSLGIERPEGVLITDIHPGSSASRSGLKEGDVVLRVNQEPVNDQAGLRYQTSLLRPGSSVPVTIWRQQKTLNLTLKAETAPESPPRDERALKGEHPLAGAMVVNLSPALAEELGIDAVALSNGVMVRSLTQRSYAFSVGLRPGDIILSINGQKVASTRELETIMQSGSRNWRISINRNGQDITANFRGA